MKGTDLVGAVLANPAYFLPRVSATFHGRDVFAPVAAHLSRGVPLSSLGPPLADLVVLPAAAPRVRPGEILGKVIHVDRFGNAITNLTAADLAEFVAPVVDVAGREIVGISHHYAERAGLLALIESSDHLEVAVNGGNAAAVLGIKAGDPVVVREKDA